MKKIILASFLSLAFIFTLSACGQKNTAEEATKKLGLSEWLNSGKGTVCVVKTPGGEVTVKTKDGKTKMNGVYSAGLAEDEGASGNIAVTSIFDGDWVYTWSGAQGTKYNVEKMKALSEEDGEEFNEDDYDWEAWAKSQEEANVVYDCHNENISDSEFDVPSDVQFTDFNELMSGFQNLGENLSDKLGDTSSMNQEDLEAQLDELMNKAGIKQ